MIKEMHKKDPGKKSINLRELISWARSIFFAFILVFLLIRPFLVQAYMVPTPSMENTILVGDWLLVNKFSFGGISPHRLPFTDFELPYFRVPGYDDPERNDIIVFEYPLNRSQDFVKRCVAVGGDTVGMRDKVLYVNHQPQGESCLQHLDSQIRREENRLYPTATFAWQKQYLAGDSENGPGAEKDYRPTRDNFGPLVVPEGKYFCLGDNRDSSSDSRFWGFVDRELVKGKPMFLYFSWDMKRKLPRLGRFGRIVQ
ncbi:MAG: signal peptidase I [Gemmatimonadota bacterium]|nr:signal peptidase I [Gemmatimonadota bacterium]